jgi:hypothetical protein
MEWRARICTQPEVAALQRDRFWAQCRHCKPFAVTTNGDSSTTTLATTASTNDHPPHRSRIQWIRSAMTPTKDEDGGRLSLTFH